MKRAMKWFLCNAIAGFLLWAAIFQGVEGAGNVLIVWTWLMLIVSAIALGHDGGEAVRRNGRSVPSWLAWVVGMTFAATFIWHGWWVTGIAYFFSFVFIQAAYVEGKKA